MRWLITMVVAVVLALILSTAASGYTFGDWARDNGYFPHVPMPSSVYADTSFPAIDSLDGIGEYNWTNTPTTDLSLYKNQISSIESGTFNGLTSLTNLNLHRNQISSIESGDFSGLTDLEHLHLSYNQISSIESSDFSGLTNLEWLDLNSNQISSIESSDFSELTNLTILHLDGNQISSIESGDFSELTNLTYLNLQGNQISSIESGDFSGLTDLESLYLNYNQLSSIEAGDFSGPTNLTSLHLELNQISSIESGAFSGMANLRRIDLTGNQLTSIESGAFSGLPNLWSLSLGKNTALTELNLEAADFSSLAYFGVDDNVNITSVSLRNTVVNQSSLVSLMGSGSMYRTGIGELDATILEMDLSGIDFGNITDLSPLYVMDDLTDLWLVDTVNLNASDLDVLLDNLETIEGRDTEGILHMTQTNYDVFGPLLATWHGEAGHHVEFVVPGDFDTDGDVDGNDFLIWQRGESPFPMSSSDMAEWQANFGDVVTEPPELRADFDGNDKCDGDDLLIWETNFGAVDPFGRPVHEFGDADEDSDIDGSDFLIWQTNYGIGVASSASSANVPEPTTGILLMLVMTVILSGRGTIVSKLIR